MSIGSNVDREAHIPESLRQIAELFGPLIVSSVYESEAVGFQGDPFFNLAVGFSSELPALEIARILREIEIAHGRTENSRKFEPRSLDIDLIIYGDQVLNEGGLRLPRDEIARYAFMLEPLAEIAPDFTHPGLGRTFAQLWASFEKSFLRQKKLGLPKA